MAERKEKTSDLAGISQAAESDLTGSTRPPAQRPTPSQHIARPYTPKVNAGRSGSFSFLGASWGFRRATVCNSRSAFPCAFAQFCQNYQSAIIPFIHAGFVHVHAVVAHCQLCFRKVSARLGVRFKLFSQCQVLFIIMVTPQARVNTARPLPLSPVSGLPNSSPGQVRRFRSSCVRGFFERAKQRAFQVLSGYAGTKPVNRKVEKIARPLLPLRVLPRKHPAMPWPGHLRQGAEQGDANARRVLCFPFIRAGVRRAPFRKTIRGRSHRIPFPASYGHRNATFCA
jgi:hypothetical protein